MPIKPKLEIIDPTDKVICEYCGKSLSKRDEAWLEVREGHFAHKLCAELEEKRELTDEEKLNNYIKKIFNTSFVPPLIQKQIKNYIKDYNYSYSGMLKALVYGVEISHRLKPDFNFPTLGYLPYIYQDAYNYYYSLWLAEQANTGKLIVTPEVENVVIVSPKKVSKIKQQFKNILEDNIDVN